MTQFYFKPFEKIQYGGQKAVNLMRRYEVKRIIEDRASVYYTYHVVDGERPDVVAHKYYNDARLDWIIFITNDIFDIEYDWPLSYENLKKYIRSKYGSVSDAKNEIHHYEWIKQEHKKLFDGTIVPEKSFIVDKDTYDTLSPNERRVLSSYDYEINLNEEKAEIQLLDERYVESLLKEVEGVFN